MKKYKILNIDSPHKLNDLSQNEIYKCDVLIHLGNLLKNRTEFTNSELTEMTNGFADLSIINNSAQKDYKFLLIRR
jgi:hypothetical protein